MLTGYSLSKSKYLNDGVPQGSRLGPVLFNMFLTTFCDLVDENEIMYQVYADDTLLCFERKFDNRANHDKLERLPVVLCNWFASAGLKLQPDKTEIVLIKTVKTTFSWKRVKVLNDTVDIKAELKSIGIFLDNSLNQRRKLQQLLLLAIFNCEN